ncbi:hypothetical protein COV16_01070 [Candidatus Woesearchaeota archaeon CG10_big_fil_rev_8_21_14_0_10_34_8]|nr:MAG: hypothetical protein COV16_01070 [Candidatus Woesearchaeota archaeon CG10_big_fil_rev_8_21_14_0_10_34_8]
MLESARAIEARIGDGLKPEFLIQTGSGQSKMLDNIVEVEFSCDRREFNFPVVGAEGHTNEIVYGFIEGVPVIWLKGRVHYYEKALEVAPMRQVVFPVYVAACMGVKNYFAMSAVGGLNPEYEVGDLMVVYDHVKHASMPDPTLGRLLRFEKTDGGVLVPDRHPGLHEAYDKSLRNALLIYCGSIRRHDIKVGKLISVAGPSYESNGEAVHYRDNLGGDAVGMSLADSVIGARSVDMCCTAMSIVSNLIGKDGSNPVNHKSVTEVMEDPILVARLGDVSGAFFKKYREDEMKV